MGGIFSRMSDYVYNSVENTRLRIKNKIDNTKNGIYTRVNNVKTGITTRVTNTRDGVYKFVDDTKTGIKTRVNAVKDGVVSRYNYVRDGVAWRYNYVKTTVTDTRDAVVTRYTHTKDAVVTRYTNTKYTVQSKYRQMREAKLTRWQKFKYSLLFLFVLIAYFISMAIMWDLWCGDLDAAADKVHALWEFVCFVITNVYIAVSVTLSHVWWGLCVVGEYTWAGTVVAAHHLRIWGTVCGEYALHGAKVTGHYTWEGTKICAAYIWSASTFIGENLLITLRVVSEYLLLGSQLALDYTIEGSKVAGYYIAEGSKYSYEHGSVAARDLAIRFGKWLVYFFTNFREASYDAGVFLWEGGLWLGAALLNGSYTGGLILIDVTIRVLTTSYHWIIATVTWIYVAVTTTANFTANLAENTSNMIANGSLSAWDLICQAAEAVYTGTLTAAAWSYKWAWISAETLAEWTVISAEFVWTWGTAIVLNTSHALYVAINRFGLKWLYALGNGIINSVCVIGGIMLKFITDVGTYTGGFLFVAGTHIYNVLYILVMFVYQIVSSVAAVIRSVLRGVSIGATGIFSAVIWTMNETIFAYMYMLQKYNAYREILFVGFVVLTSMYCTGLIRDRKRATESDEEDSEEEEEEEEEVDGQGDRVRLYPSRKDLELPPIYTPGSSPDNLPAYDDVVSTSVSEEVVHALPSDSDESDFGLEQAVPDFMDSASEGEPESPECDQETKVFPGKLHPSEADLLLDAPDSEGHSDGMSDGHSEGHDPGDLADDESDSGRDEMSLAERVAAIKQQKGSAQVDEVINENSDDDNQETTPAEQDTVEEGSPRSDQTNPSDGD